MDTTRRVIIFDLGGVVADSPILAIRRFCRDIGVIDMNPFLGKSDAFHSFMQGKLKPSDFPNAVHKECVDTAFREGVQLGVDGWTKLLASMTQGGHRPLMIRTLRRLRQAGFRLAALTNNYDTEPLPDPKQQAQAEQEQSKFVALFDHFIESRVVGLSKPDPKFYEYALKVIGCLPGEAVFLDDIGANLKPPKRMGIHTIHVNNDTDTSFHQALRDLETVTGVDLLHDGGSLVSAHPNHSRL